MSKSGFEQILNRDGRLVYSSVGDSMLPMIRQGRDLLVIQKPAGRLKKYDIPLYRRENGRYVLHRILKVRDRDYVVCGDNRWHCETGITDRHIIGVLTAVITDGVEKPLAGWRYGLYVFFWCRLFPLRAMILRVCSVLKRLGKRGRNKKAKTNEGA